MNRRAVRRLSAFGLIVTLVVSAVALDGRTAEPARAKVRIALAGDSTVTNQSGWGPGFAVRLGPDAECINLARSGRSSKSYINEGHWKKLLDAKPDTVLIQFGHNDQPGKWSDRGADPERPTVSCLPATSTTPARSGPGRSSSPRSRGGISPARGRSARTSGRTPTRSRRSPPRSRSPSSTSTLAASSSSNGSGRRPARNSTPSPGMTPRPPAPTEPICRGEQYSQRAGPRRGELAEVEPALAPYFKSP